MTDTAGSFATLGWQVTPTLDPRYWLSPAAKAGSQVENDLVRVPTKALANHTAIIAQSGSGKSFLLGRLIEELLLESRARCVIIDPNSDFRKINEVQPAQLWSEAKYNTSGRSGRLPHERSRDQFSARWSEISIRIRTGNVRRSGNSERLKLWWPSLSVEFLAEELDPMLRSDLYHIHAFVKALEPLFLLKQSEKQPVDFIDEAERLFRQGRQRSEEDFRKDLEREFNARELQARLREVDKYYKYAGIPQKSGATIRYYWRPFWASRLLDPRYNSNLRGLQKAPKYVSEVVERFYFGKAREYQAAGILETEPESERLRLSRRGLSKSLSRSFKRLEVVDLPSLPDGNTRLLAANTIIGEEWESARATWSSTLGLPPENDYRVPTFIVIDEAHNLIPANPRSKAEAALREQFRTIVAEGRKYGLFLIVVSQRPDKLDPLVISECENKIVMKLGSISILDITRRLLGLEDTPSRLLEKCLEFEKGRGILIGEWSRQGPQMFYCAARRTVEGGRDLRQEHWALPAAPGDLQQARISFAKRIVRKTKKKGKSRKRR